ncbi:hypothetical protein L7F22_056795 [Adiantum nelumboides]|nr:hypothetical protein [Adiantum nelumboides]
MLARRHSPTLSKGLTPRLVDIRLADIKSNRGARAVNLASTQSYALGIVKMKPDTQLASKGPQMDLNSQLEKEEEMGKSPHGLSMKSLLQNASYPLDIYLKRHGLTSLVCIQQMP